MKTIEFDLEKAKSGEYEIVTEKGAPVRIICWDKQDGVFKLVGLVKDTDGDEFCQSYDEHGDAREGDTSFNLRLVCPDPVSELLELALEKYWRPSDKTGVSVLRYTIQDNVIYDCVSGTEMPICDVVNVVVNALNHCNEYWDERNLTRKPVDSRPSVTLPNIKDVRYEGLKQCDEIDVINKHITNTTLSDEVNTRLNNCGWFVCDKNDIRGLIEYFAEIEKNM